MRSIYLLALGLLAALALPTIAAEQKGDARLKNKTNQQYEVMKTNRGKATRRPKAEALPVPDVTVEILPSNDPHHPALAKIVNIGTAGTGSFQLTVQIKALCEAGKLTTTVLPLHATRTIQNVAAGDDEFTSIMPQGQVWAGNCFFTVKAVASSVSNETNTSNNTGSKTFCPTGSCY